MCTMKWVLFPTLIMGLFTGLGGASDAGTLTTVVYLKHPLPFLEDSPTSQDKKTFPEFNDYLDEGVEDDHSLPFSTAKPDGRPSKDISTATSPKSTRRFHTKKESPLPPFQEPHPFHMFRQLPGTNAMRRKELEITEMTDDGIHPRQRPAGTASTESAGDRSFHGSLFASATPSITSPLPKPSASPEDTAVMSEYVTEPVSPFDDPSDKESQDFPATSEMPAFHTNGGRDRSQNSHGVWSIDTERKLTVGQKGAGSEDIPINEEKKIVEDGDLTLQNSSRHVWYIFKEPPSPGTNNKHSKDIDLNWKPIRKSVNSDQITSTHSPVFSKHEQVVKPSLSNDSPYDAFPNNGSMKPVFLFNTSSAHSKHKIPPKYIVRTTESSAEGMKGGKTNVDNGFLTSAKPSTEASATDRSINRNIPQRGSEIKDKKTPPLKPIAALPPPAKGSKDSFALHPTSVFWTLSEIGVGVPTMSADGVLSNKKAATESTEKDVKWVKEIPSLSPPHDKSPSSTTPDSHMNDPPWNRGPNVFPPEHETIPKIKEVPKEDKDKKDPLVETPVLYSEPEPEWEGAKKVWGPAWEAHYYATGSLFGLLAIYSFVSLLRVRTYARLLSRGYFMSANTTLCILGVTRAVHLLYDPYNSHHSLPPAIVYVMYNLTHPCLTTAFAVLFLSLLQSTKTRLLSPKIQRSGVLVCIVVFHFSFAITTDVILGTNLGGGGARLLRFACLAIFLVWCVALFFGYFFAFKKLHHAALRKQGEMIRVTFTKLHIDGAQLPKKLPRPTLAMAVKVTLVCSVVGLFLAMLQLGGAVCIYGIAIWKKPDPWPWWGYQLTSRLLELVVCAMISFIATQPVKYFEQGNSKFCNVLTWFPCSVFTKCSSSQKDEAFDFETHSDYYANLQGFRNCGFGAADGPRRWGQTNSLPTFRTPSSEVDNTLTMRNFPHTGRGRNTNHPSAISLLSYYRSKRNLSLSTSDGLDDLERTIGNQATLSSVSEGRTNTIRPASMLYKDKGFIRFRTEADPEQPMELTDEEDDDRVDDDCDSTKANAGSSFHSLLDDEEDIVQSTLSPFFQSGYHRRLRRMSRVSLETTDNSVDLSFEHLSNVTSRNGLSSSALDFNLRKYGSTCSSESAANSFDVTFFLNGSSVPIPTPSSLLTGATAAAVRAATEGAQQAASSSSSSALAVTGAYRSETEDEKTSSVDGHEVMLRSVSPIVSRTATAVAVAAASRRVHELPLSLNFTREGDGNQVGRVNASCGTEDITPDSAVYLDIQFAASKADDDTTTNSSPRMMDASPHSSDTSAPDVSPEDMSPELSNSAPVFFQTSSTSQSMNDLRTSSYVPCSKARRTSRSLLNKLRGSTFSLNAAINGYEPLESEDNAYYPRGQSSRRRLRRAISDRRPGSAQEQRVVSPLADGRNSGSASFGGLCQGDSGLLRDCQDYVTHVDEASQTDPSDVHIGLMTTCSDTIRLGRVSSDAISCRLMNLKE